MEGRRGTFLMLQVVNTSKEMMSHRKTTLVSNSAEVRGFATAQNRHVRSTREP